MRISRLGLAALMLVGATFPAFADDWVAVNLRGIVMQFDGKDWVHLDRGDIVSDARHIRTLASGRVEFERGQERISMAGDTDITINDARGRKMTTVNQMFGSVTIEAEKKNVQHFAVQTPVLAAVVKGTQFTVTYRNGQGQVKVDRGVVQVTDDVHNVVANVTVGQSAKSSESGVLKVSGPGSDETVYVVDGNVVSAREVANAVSSTAASQSETASSSAGAQGQASSGKANAGPGNNNAGGNGNGNFGSGSAGSQGQTSSGNANAGPGNNNAGGNGNGNSGSGSAGSQGQASSGNANAGPGNNNAGGNGNGNGNGVSANASVGGLSVSVSVGGNGLGLGLGRGRND